MQWECSHAERLLIDMQNTDVDSSDAKVILESSKITGNKKLHIPEYGVYAEGNSHTSIVASEVSCTGSCGIHCVGKALCYVQSSVVSGCQGEGIVLLECSVSGSTPLESRFGGTSSCTEQNIQADDSGERFNDVNRCGCFVVFICQAACMRDCYNR